MIYTVGKIDVYEQYIATDAHPQKAGRCEGHPGGSVWETQECAQAYLDSVGLNIEYRVYGVLADWQTQTEARLGQLWRDLLIDANLVKL